MMKDSFPNPSHFAASREFRVLAFLIVVVCLPVQSDSTVVSYSGFLIDVYCWNLPNHRALDGHLLHENPERHTVKCLRDVPECRNGGFAVLEQLSSGIYSIKYRFDAEGNKRALALIDSTEKKDNFVVTVSGEDDGSEVLKDVSFKEGAAPPRCQADEGNFPCSETLSIGNLTMHWRLVPKASGSPKQMVDLKVVAAPGSNYKYMSLGFGRVMEDTEVVVGYTEEGAALANAYRLPSWSPPTEACTDCAVSDWSFASTAEDGQTLQFTAELPGGDPFATNDNAWIIFAHSESSAWEVGSSSSYHDQRGMMLVDWAGGLGDAPVPPPSSDLLCTRSTVADMNCQLQLTDQLVVHWKVGDSSVEFVLQAAAGTNPRYLGLGLGSEMDQSRVVVGYLQDGDVPAANAYLLPKYTAPAENSCATAPQGCPFSGMSYTNEDVAELRFTVAMDSAGSPAATSMVWSLGSRNWPASHAQRGAVKLNLASGAATKIESPLKTEHTVHGALMVAAWMVLVPTASAIARGARELLGAPNWFYAHAGLQLLAGVLFIAGIAYAIAEFDSQDIPKAHKEVGVAVLALWVVQIVAAVFRPDNHGQKNFCVPPEWRARWLILHRAGFVVLMVLAACNCITGAMRYDDIHGNRVFEWLTVALLAAFGLLFVVIEVKNSKVDQGEKEPSGATNCP